jgi:hypothetical protein
MLSMSFTVRSTDAGFAEALAWHFAPFRRRTPEVQAFNVDLYVQERDADTDPRVHSFFIANALRYRRHDLAEVLENAIWALHAEVSKQVQDLVLLHAGAVARGGDALVLPARMGVGKSTLVLALLQRGFGYLSDELGAIDPVTGRVYPFEKRIGLDEAAVSLFDGLSELLGDRDGPGAGIPKRSIRPEDVGSVVAGPSSPRWIVFPGTDRSGEPRLTAITRAEAVERMAAHGMNLFRYGERGVIVLGRVAEAAEAFVLDGGSSAERAALLEAQFG